MIQGISVRSLKRQRRILRVKVGTLIRETVEMIISINLCPHSFNCNLANSIMDSYIIKYKCFDIQK